MDCGKEGYLEAVRELATNILGKAHDIATGNIKAQEAVFYDVYHVVKQTRSHWTIVGEEPNREFRLRFHTGRGIFFIAGVLDSHGRPVNAHLETSIFGGVFSFGDSEEDHVLNRKLADCLLTVANRFRYDVLEHKEVQNG